jgi:hypothetical protein
LILCHSIFMSENIQETKKLMGDGYWRYNVEANRKELEAVMRDTHEQGLIKERRKFKEMFHPLTLDLVG